MKIVVTNNQDMSPEQKARLESLGDVTWYDSLPRSGGEYFQRVKDADIICSGTSGLKDAYAQLRDVYVTVGFVSTAFVDSELMRKNGVQLSNSPGINRHAVSEWVVAMMLLISRNLLDAVNRDETYRKDGALPPLTYGLAGRNLTIIGKGNVGQRVGEIAESFDMNVNYFTRGDDLHACVKDADIAVDALSENASTENILDDAFFASMKKGAIFITVSRSAVVDEDALIRYLNNGHLAGAATDCGGILVGDTNDELYKKMRAHPKIVATPHIAYNTAMSMKLGNDVMIDNVEAYINGTPQNLVN